MSLLIIDSFQPQFTWPYGGDTATLRIQYSADFIDSSGQQILRGLYKDVPCTVAGGVLTVGTFTLSTTNDALVNPLATCSARFIDANGTPRDWLFQNFIIPQALVPSANIGALTIYNQGASLVLPPSFYLDSDQTTKLVIALLNSIGVLANASATVKGITKLSVDPAILTEPIARGVNDPLDRDALKIQGIDVTANPPADTNRLGYNAGTDEIEWVTGVGPVTEADLSFSDITTANSDPTKHGLLPKLSNDATEVLDGEGNFVPVPLHASRHQDGGADEINVGGLNGLLADPQTPDVHASTHEAGGSDAIKLDDLAAPDDNTDLNASTGAHGLLPKLSNDPGEFLNGQGAWAVPPGGGGAPTGATYITQTSNSELSAEQALDALATGLVKNTNGTGVLSIAAAGTDYVAPTATVVDETGAPVTLDSAHNGKVVLVDDDVTVPSGLGVGFNCLVVQVGASAITFIPSSTTINNRQSHTKTAGQYAAATLVAYASDTFILGGDTAS